MNVGMEELVEGAGAVLVFEGEDCWFCRLATLTESAGGELGLSARGLFGVWGLFGVREGVEERVVAKERRGKELSAASAGGKPPSDSPPAGGGEPPKGNPPEEEALDPEQKVEERCRVEEDKPPSPRCRRPTTGRSSPSRRRRRAAQGKASSNRD